MIPKAKRVLHEVRTGLLKACSPEVLNIQLG